jgi:two-component system, chemotaxis family, protein-glutamate methylesterase/glutaminase
MADHDIIVMGASAGGVEALEEVVQGLPADLPASLFIVLHLPSNYKSVLAEILQSASALPVTNPPDNTPIESGHIYVARSDYHMILQDRHVRMLPGPKENRHRPAIDPLFRSAAWAYGSRVIGVLLTGALDDGVAGLWAVQSCGGLTIVQDPKTAHCPDMPRNALRSMRVDYRVPLAEIGPLLVRLTMKPNKRKEETRPEIVRLETELLTRPSRIEDMNKLGAPTVFTCPTCRGALWELQAGGLLHYRCHTGHAFSMESLLAEQTDASEAALYSALRALEEKRVGLQRAAESLKSDSSTLKPDLEARAREAEESADVIRDLLSGARSANK